MRNYIEYMYLSTHTERPSLSLHIQSGTYIQYTYINNCALNGIPFTIHICHIECWYILWWLPRYIYSCKYHSSNIHCNKLTFFFWIVGIIRLLDSNDWINLIWWEQWTVNVFKDQNQTRTHRRRKESKGKERKGKE